MNDPYRQPSAKTCDRCDAPLQWLTPTCAECCKTTSVFFDFMSATMWIRDDQVTRIRS